MSPQYYDLSEAVDAWIKSTCRSESGAARYRYIIKHFLSQKGWQKLSDWKHKTTDDLWNEITKLLFYERTKRLYWMTQRSWTTWLIENGLMTPIHWKKGQRAMMRIDHERVVRGGDGGKRTAMTRKQTKKALEWAQTLRTRHRAMVLLMMLGGLRGCEIERLQWGDITKETIRISGKGNKSRFLYLSFEPEIRKAIEDLKPNGLTSVFGVKVRTVQKWAKKAWFHGGSSGTAHGLRRTAATLLVERGNTLEQVRDFLGHCSVETTQRCYVARKQKLFRNIGIRR